METESFILVLRYFIGRRDRVRSIRCQNRNTFVGAEKELARTVEELSHNKVEAFLHSKQADWIKWKRNPPLVNHMGGLRERDIRSARAILSVTLITRSSSLDEKALNTLFAEVVCCCQFNVIRCCGNHQQCRLQHYLPVIFLR